MRKNLSIVDSSAGTSVTLTDTGSKVTIFRWTVAQNATVYFSGRPVLGDKFIVQITSDGTARTITFDNTTYTKAISFGTLTTIPSNSYEFIFEFNGTIFVELSRKNLTNGISICPNLNYSYTAGATGTALTTAVIIKEAAAGLKNFVKSIQILSASATALRVDILDDTTVIASYPILANMITPIVINFPDGFGASVNKNLNFQLSAAPTTGNVYVNAQGYQGL